MKIRYSVTIDDVVTFVRYHDAHSATARRRRWIVTGALVGVLSAAAGLFAMRGDWTLCAAVLVGLAIGLVARSLLVRRIQERTIRAAYREGDNKGIIGPQELELSPPDLLGWTPVSQSKRWFGAYEKVVVTQTHAYLYQAAALATVIPRAAVTDGDFDAFVQTVAQEVEQAKRDGQRSI